MSEKLDSSDIHNILTNTQVFKVELFMLHYIPEVGIKG